MSALVGYYQAMTADRQAAAGLADAQAQQTRNTSDEVAANAASQRGLQATQSGLQSAQAGAITAKLPGEIDATAAQVGASRAQAASLNANTALAAPLATSEIGLRSAQAGLTGAQAGVLPSEIAKNNASVGGLNASTQQTLLGNQIIGDDRGRYLDQVYGVPSNSLTPGNIFTTAARGIFGQQQQPINRAEGGMASSGGKGKDPKGTDTIPAMLSPGEAILNRGATEHLGGGIIDHLNKLGMMRMAAQDEVKAHADAIDGHSVSAVHKAAMKSRKAKAKTGAKR